MVTPTASVTDSNTVGWRFDNTYSRLPDIFFAPAKPATARAPRVSILNHRLADELGLDLGAMSPEVAAALFAGQDLPGGSRPIAQAYAGHQFGGFTMLGDGRAILLGEHRTPSGRLVDIQLKGAGPTRFSRRGDGLAALGPMLREYVISEAISALGIPTTRSLAVVTTGEPVYRESALRGAILTRVAASHLRVGTFQYLATRQDQSNLRVLADYAIDRHYPELIDAPRNVNGLRSCAKKQFLAWLLRSGADVVGVQEVCARLEDLPDHVRQPRGWHATFVAGERRGYSGVGLLGGRLKSGQAWTGQIRPKERDPGRRVSTPWYLRTPAWFSNSSART